MSGADPVKQRGPWDDRTVAAGDSGGKSAAASLWRIKLDSHRIRTAIWLNIAFQTVTTAAVAFFVLKHLLAK